ncbi:GAF and ANTAR domain-containing protein [Arthrobacter sp. TMN-50]
MADGTASALEKVCSTVGTSFIDALPVSGAALSAFGGSLQETTLWASDALAARLDELQFDLGEGPRWTAIRSRAPVLVPRVRSDSHSNWPVFGNALLETDAQALFIFPLAIGVMDIGVVELYCTSPGPLSRSDLATARSLADGAAWTLLRSILASDPDDGEHRSYSWMSRREIHQATGMVLAQTGGTAADALLILRGHAFANGLTLRQTSDDVLGRRIDFTPSML